MANNIPTDFPQDMRDLLIEMSFEVKNINKNIEKIDAKTGDHEDRLRKIEHDQSDREQLKNRFFKSEDAIQDIRTRVHTIEANAQSNSNWLEWAWKMFGTPATLFIGFLIVLYAGTVQKNATAISHQPPAAATAPH